MLAHNKSCGLPKPWSDDSTLARFRFCNVKWQNDFESICRFRVLDKHMHSFRSHSVNALGFAFFTVDFWKHWLGTRLCLDKFEDEERQSLLKSIETFKGNPFKDADNAPLHSAGVTPEKAYAAAEQIAGILSVMWEKADDFFCKYERHNRQWVVLVKEIKYGIKGVDEFYAKEATIAFVSHSDYAATDLRTYSPCPTGARKGLNLVYGYEPDQYVLSKSAEGHFLRMASFMFEELRRNHSEFCRHHRLTILHDITWNLCEFQKHQLKRKLRPYTPRARNFACHAQPSKRKNVVPATTDAPRTEVDGDSPLRKRALISETTDTALEQPMRNTATEPAPRRSLRLQKREHSQDAPAATHTPLPAIPVWDKTRRGNARSSMQMVIELDGVWKKCTCGAPRKIPALIAEEKPLRCWGCGWQAAKEKWNKMDPSSPYVLDQDNGRLRKQYA